jgi:hypothetical protein
MKLTGLWWNGNSLSGQLTSFLEQALVGRAGLVDLVVRARGASRRPLTPSHLPYRLSKLWFSW